MAAVLQSFLFAVASRDAKPHGIGAPSKSIAGLRTLIEAGANSFFHRAGSALHA